MYGPKHFITRHWRLILFAVVIAVIGWIFYVLRSIIFPFLIGLLLAYMLLPAVYWIEVRLPQKKRWLKINRAIAIVIIFTLFIAATVVFFLYIFTIIFNTASSLLANADSIITSASAIVNEWTSSFFQHIPTSMRAEAGKYLTDIVTQITDAVRNFVEQTIMFIPATIGFIAGLITTPVFVFIVLLDWETLRDGFYARMSPRTAEYLRNIIGITGDTMRRYFRGQFIMSIIIGLADFAAMSVLGVGFAPALGAIAAVGEYIPWAGPAISWGVAILVALATAPDRVIWVIAWYFIVQFIENNVLVPKIQGGMMNIHPAIVLVVLVFGAQFAGFWGLLFALPATAIIVKVYAYFQHVSAVEDQRSMAKGGRDDH